MLKKDKLLKVKATVEERYVDPDNIAVFNCPYCGIKLDEEVFDENVTIEHRCWGCKKVFKVKIPKFY